jgi:UPF0176 protein
VLVASEGINGAIAGELTAVSAFEDALRQWTGVDTASIRFKHSACRTPPFGRFVAHVRPELVQMGVAGIDAKNTPGLLSPQQWRELLDDPNVVLIDNRNHFEYRLGRFRGAIDPQVRDFHAFRDYMQRQWPVWQQQNKRVAMYCTGGIRCEKSAAWLATLAIPVLQLDGGILGYFEAFPDDAEADFQGDCFVFDNRLALTPKLAESQVSIEAIYQAEPDGAFRIARAQRLRDAVAEKTDDASDNASDNASDDATAD